jgi:hypothetical protein
MKGQDLDSEETEDEESEEDEGIEEDADSETKLEYLDQDIKFI